MASFYIPLSGLNADSKALNTIANNLSNMNTTAYKSEKTNFSDLFYQQIGSTGSGDPIQVGSGVRVASNNADFTQGSFDTSGTTSSDVALDGNGFFLVNDGNTNFLTRNGAFTQNASGNLVTASGLAVMGYQVVNGQVNAAAPLAPIDIPVIGQVQQPQATTTFGMTANLDSSAAIGTTVPGQVQVFDSLGTSYEATVTYTKTGTNQWSYSVTMPDTLSMNQNLATGTISYNFGSSGGTLATVDPATNLTITGVTSSGATATIVAPTVKSGETVLQYVTALTDALSAADITGVQVTSDAAGQLSIAGSNITSSGTVIQDPVASANASGSLTFDSSGNLVSPATNVAGITFAGLSDGAAAMNMTWSLLGSSGKPTISQVHGTSSASASTQNGYASGAYQGFGIGADGTVYCLLFKRAETGRRTTCPGQCHQPPGPRAAGQRSLCNHSSQWGRIHRHVRHQRAGQDSGFGARTVQRQHLRRVLQPDHCATRFRGKLQGDHHLRHHHSGNHQHDPLI